MTTGTPPNTPSPEAAELAKARAEIASLQESHDRLAAILDRVHDGFVALDRDWRYTFVNRRAAVMLQRKVPEDLLGRHIWTEYPEGVGRPFHRAYLKAMETQQPVFIEEWYEPWDLWFENRIYPSPEGLSIFFTEITERKRAEAALRQSERALSEAQRLAHIGRWELDLRTRQPAWSNEVYRMLEVDPGGPALTYERFLDRILPEDRALATQVYADSIRNREPFSFDHRLMMEDGRIKHVHSHCETFYDDHGEPVRSVGYLQDITRQKEAEAKRRELEIQVQQAQKMDSLGSLASGVAHDMNNVLGAILGLATAFRESRPGDSELGHVLDTVTRACDRGRTLVQGLLDFSRKGVSEPLVVDLNALVRDEVRLLERTTLQRVQLAADLEPDLRPVRGDPAALSHALMNLCVNAVDAMPEGGTLGIRTRNVAADQVSLSVVDTGRGMTPDVLARATEPFFTTKPAGKGTGLGLSIVYGTVKAHGGVLELRSTPGRGTTAEIRLPACAAETPDQPVQAGIEARSPAVHHRVLLVDDDELLRTSMEILIRILGFDIVAAASGEEAISHLAQGLRPTVVILDLNMPGLGGPGTLRRVRELLPDTPVLLTTGLADEHAQDVAASFPGVTLLPKPFSIHDLRARLLSLRPLPPS